MDTYDEICMWCSKAIMMKEEEYKVFKSILLGEVHSEQDEELIYNTIAFIDKMRDP